MQKKVKTKTNIIIYVYIMIKYIKKRAPKMVVYFSLPKRFEIENRNIIMLYMNMII